MDWESSRFALRPSVERSPESTALRPGTSIGTPEGPAGGAVVSEEDGMLDGIMFAVGAKPGVPKVGFDRRSGWMCDSESSFVRAGERVMGTAVAPSSYPCGRACTRSCSGDC